MNAFGHKIVGLLYNKKKIDEEAREKPTSEISNHLLKISQMPIAEVFKELNTSERGLTERQAHVRLQKIGLNEIAHEKAPAWYILLLRNFANPFNILLLFLSVVSFLLGDMDATLIIVCMVILSVIMRFIQEYRSSRAAEKLKAMVSTSATVLRREKENDPPKKREIPLKYLVPGDVVQLAAGDMVPADVRLITSKDLYLSQSALTGEALPVEKYTDSTYSNGNNSTKTSNTNPLDQPSLCFLGTNVMNGSATAVIVETGNHTFFGSMAQTIVGYRTLTSFDIGVNKVSWLLIRFMAVMVPVVFFLNGFTKHDWVEALLFALSVAVGLTPEMLPMIVTANLARGAVKMAKHKVIVKRLNSIQNFGAMNILCTDKTGTLTQDRIILEKHLGLEGEDNDEVLEYAYLNSFYQTGLKNLLDVAVLDYKELEKDLQLEHRFKKIDEIPFDFKRRRMSVVVEKEPKIDLLICKGAVEEMMAISTTARMNGQIVPLSNELIEKSKRLRDELNEDGLRVLAVAYKEIVPQGKREYYVKDETEMTLLGFIAFLDPPKGSTTEAIAILQEYGVQIKVITGDNELVTRKICKWVKLDIQDALLGSEVEAMNDEELKKAVDNTTIFAKMAPLQKSRVISALKSNGHTVGYLGDGINDAPALREADIGISVDTAVDIAKESADIIMLEKSLLFLGEGVIEGRKTFGNIIKYIKMAASSNFGNVFSVLGASAILPFLPMLPLQLLVQNFLYDISQTTIPFDSVDKEYLLKPRKWDSSGIARFMVFIGPISSIFDYVTFAVMWFVFAANSPASQALFQTGWFVEGLLSQTLIVHMIRTQKIPFIQSCASWPLITTTILVMAFGIYIPYSYIGASIGMVPLHWSYYPWLLGILLSYCVLTQLVKNWFVRRYNYWL